MTHCLPKTQFKEAREKKVNISEKQEDALKINIIPLKTEVGDDKWKNSNNKELGDTRKQPQEFENSPVVQLQLKQVPTTDNKLTTT